jgi:hypothetical protein
LLLSIWLQAFYLIGYAKGWHSFAESQPLPRLVILYLIAASEGKFFGDEKVRSSLYSAGKDLKWHHLRRWRTLGWYGRAGFGEHYSHRLGNVPE